MKTSSVHQRIERRNNDKGQDCGKGQTEDHRAGHRAPPLARLTDPGDLHLMEIIGNAGNHRHKAKYRCYRCQQNRAQTGASGSDNGLPEVHASLVKPVCVIDLFLLFLNFL
jgi:hypothetical protein